MAAWKSVHVYCAFQTGRESGAVVAISAVLSVPAWIGVARSLTRELKGFLFLPGMSCRFSIPAGLATLFSCLFLSQGLEVPEAGIVLLLSFRGYVFIDTFIMIIEWLAVRVRGCRVGDPQASAPPASRSDTGWSCPERIDVPLSRRQSVG